MSGWTTTPLRRLVRFGNGRDYKDVEAEDGFYPVYGSGGEFARASAYLHDGPSVLFGRKGTVDRPMYVTGRFWTVDTMYYTVPGPEVDPKFLYYWATTVPYGLLSTNTALPSMTSGVLGALPVAHPARQEQRRIADYLDRETATIDALIDRQRTLINGLKKRRSAAIEQGVGGRLTSSGVKQSTGPSWMGMIPSTWRAVPLWTMYRREKRTGFLAEPMVSVFRDFGVVFKSERANLNETAEDRSIYQLVEPGWFVVNRMKAWQGSVGVSGIRGISSGHYLCFRPLHGEDNRFLKWLFRSPQYRHGFAMLSRGVRPGQAEIDNGQLRQMAVVLPPLDEQRAIADHLDRETAKIDALIAKAERFIELAQERRAALITAAVTGQLEVPAVASS